MSGQQRVLPMRAGWIVLPWVRTGRPTKDASGQTDTNEGMQGF